MEADRHQLRPDSILKYSCEHLYSYFSLQFSCFLITCGFVYLMLA